MKSIIISGFAGVGKSTLTKQGYENYTVHDSDSSKFDKKDFPNNYLEHIKALSQQDNKIILVSCHKSIRELLYKEGIDYYLVYPKIDTKQVYLSNYEFRGSDKDFINLLNEKWDEWIDEIDNGEYPNRCRLLAGVYLPDIIDSIICDSKRLKITMGIHCNGCDAILDIDDIDNREEEIIQKGWFKDKQTNSVRYYCKSCKDENRKI